MAGTREKIIESASGRFYRDGFRGVGIDQIIADVGISKTAFYNHFESKDDVLLAVLESQDAWLRNAFERMVREHAADTARGRLLSLFDVVETIITDTSFRGCFFVNITMEFPLPHDPAHAAAARNKHAIEEIVLRLAREAGADDPRALARELCMLMEGAYVTSHVVGDRPGAVAAAKGAAEAVIDRRVPR